MRAARLARIIPHVRQCHSESDLTDALRIADPAVVFLDPLAVNGCAVIAMRIRQQVPSATIVLYTALDARAVQELAELARAGIGEIVLHGYDDNPERLIALLEDAAVSHGSQLDAIRDHLNALCPRLRCAVEEMFKHPARFRSTLDLAAFADMSIRGVFRQLKLAGFPSPRRLVVGARVLRACQLLSGGSNTCQQVARRLGYSDGDQLSKHISELIGRTASDVRKSGIRDDATLGVLRRITDVLHVAGESH